MAAMFRFFWPRRRFWQFGLKLPLALLVVAAVWLGTHASEYQSEQRILEQIRLLGGEATLAWRGPSWLPELDMDTSSGFFHRVTEVHFEDTCVDQATFARLRWEKLPWLERIGLNEFQLPDAESSVALRSRLSEGSELDYIATPQDYPILRKSLWSVTTGSISSVVDLREEVQEYIADPNRLSPGEFRQSLRRFSAPGGANFSFSSEPDELRYGCARLADSDEEAFEQLLHCSEEEAQVLGVEGLWNRRSLRYARDVVAVVEKTTFLTEPGRKIAAQVKRDLRTESVSREIMTGDLQWGAWLAAIRPEPSLLPALLAKSAAGGFPNELVYALAQYHDPRAAAALQRILASQHSSHTLGLAAQGIAKIGDSASEPDLIKRNCLPPQN